jgi:hypothetical protein
MATPTSLPASFTTGQVLTAAQMNDLRGAFRILQLSVAVMDTSQTSTTTTYVDITGASVTITPQATTNKILIVSANAFLASTNSADAGIRFLRDATNIYTEAPAIMAANTGGNFTSIYLDSPNSTSAITYKAQFNRTSGTGTVYNSIANTAGAFLVAEVSA